MAKMTNTSKELRDGIGKLFEQAFVDGSSDTMWVNDRHVEIYKTAVDNAMNLFTQQLNTAVVEARLGEQAIIAEAFNKVGKTNGYHFNYARLADKVREFGESMNDRTAILKQQLKDKE